MEELSQLCFALNGFYENLFQTYSTELHLAPVEFGFLSRDCYAPMGEDECYPIIAQNLEAVFSLLEKLREQHSSRVHRYLRELYAIVERVKKLKPAKELDKTTEEYSREIKAVIKKLIAFIKNYAYQLTPEYQANNAILLASMLFYSAKLAYRENVKVDQAVIEEVDTGKKLTLAAIAKKLCEATGIGARSVQFISIGICNSGEIWVTTNYHSPVVYPLAFLLNKDSYAEVEAYREKYKKTGKWGVKELIFSSHIHAETLMAGLKDVLGLQHILIVDGLGNKVENCPCCSHFLCVNGFSSEPHMESIQNYETPSRKQIVAVKDWVTALQEKFKANQFRLMPGATIPGKISEEAVAVGKKLVETMFRFLPFDMQPSLLSSLEQIFYVVKAHYPFMLENPTGLKETYHLAHKLSSPEKKGVNRTVVRKNVSSKRHPNKCLRFFDDGRLELAKDERSLQPKDPGSPRSRHIARYVNEWLRKGDPSITFQTEDEKAVIVLKR